MKPLSDDQLNSYLAKKILGKKYPDEPTNDKTPSWDSCNNTDQALICLRKYLYDNNYSCAINISQERGILVLIRDVPDFSEYIGAEGDLLSKVICKALYNQMEQNFEWYKEIF